MALSSSQREKSIVRGDVDTLVSRGDGVATQRSGEEGVVFIKNVRDRHGNCVADEMEPNLGVISETRRDANRRHGG